MLLYKLSRLSEKFCLLLLSDSLHYYQKRKEVAALRLFLNEMTFDGLYRELKAGRESGNKPFRVRLYNELVEFVEGVALAISVHDGLKPCSDFQKVRINDSDRDAWYVTGHELGTIFLLSNGELVDFDSNGNYSRSISENLKPATNVDQDIYPSERLIGSIALNLNRIVTDLGVGRESKWYKGLRSLKKDMGRMQMNRAENDPNKGIFNWSSFDTICDWLTKAPKRLYEWLFMW